MSSVHAHLAVTGKMASRTVSLSKLFNASTAQNRESIWKLVRNEKLNLSQFFSITKHDELELWIKKNAVHLAKKKFKKEINEKDNEKYKIFFEKVLSAKTNDDLREKFS